MTTRQTITALRDWTAFLGAVAMVGFLTFVPQHVPVSAAHVAATKPVAEISWPSRTAEMQPTERAIR